MFFKPTDLDSITLQTMTQMQDTVEASVAAAASKVTGAGSAVTVVGWATESNIGMWAGLFIGIAGLLVNTYFKLRSDHRAQAAHDVYVRSLARDVGAKAPHTEEADE